MYCLDDYVNTSYKLRLRHLWLAIMNDTKENPIVLAFQDVFGDRYYFECDEKYLYVSQNENEYIDGTFDKVRLSYNMRRFMRDFNNNQKVNPKVICLSEAPGEDWLLLHQFEENWKNVYNG